MHFCVKPPKQNKEENQEENLEDGEEKDDYLNCIIENITHELIQRLKILCLILCCVPLDKIYPNSTRPYCATEQNAPSCKEQRVYNPNGNGNGYRNENGQGNMNGNGNPYSNGNWHGNGNGYCNSNVNGHGNSNGNGHGNSNGSGHSTYNGNGHGNDNGQGNGNGYGNGHENSNRHENGNCTRRWDADNRTPKSKIRIMERSKTNTSIDSKPSIAKSIRNRLQSIRVKKEIEKIDRSIETRSSSIELYSRIDKIRILKELELTSDIEKLIGGKNEKCVKECKSQCIDTTDLVEDTVSTTDNPYSMCTDDIAGDGPQIKSRAKPTKMGGIFKRLFKNKNNVRNNKNCTEDVTGCSEMEEACTEYEDST